MSEKQKEIQRLSRQLMRFENKSPGTLKKGTLGIIDDLEQDIDYFEDDSEKEGEGFPANWENSDRDVRYNERELQKLQVELSAEEWDEGEDNNRAPEGSIDPDTIMADSSSTGQAAGQSSSSSAGQAAGQAGSSSAGQAAGQAGSSSAGQAAGQSSSSSAGQAAGQAGSSSANTAAGQAGSSGAAASTQSKDYWPLFTSKVKDEQRWGLLKSECRLFGCDFADLKFHCEIYCKLEKKDATEDQLLEVARNFMYKCPEALKGLEEMYSSDSSYHSYRDTHQRPQPPNNLNSGHEGHGRHDSSLLIEDLERDRQEVGFGRDLSEPPQDWQDIVLARDPDRKEPVEVRGKIQLIIGPWADISLPSLNPENPTMERHILVRASDYSDNMKNFMKGVKAKKLRLDFTKGDDGSSLRDLSRDQVKILHFTSARQTYMDTWPPTYAVGRVLGGEGPQEILPWTRGLCGRKWGIFNINAEINGDRQMVGQDPIVTVPRRRR